MATESKVSATDTYQPLHSKIAAALPSADVKDCGSRQEARLITIDTPDGPALIGLGYICDAAFEEEAGAGALREAFTRTAAAHSFPATLRHTDPVDTTQADLTTITDDLVVFAENPNALRYGNAYARARAFIAEQDPYVAGSTPRWRYERATVPHLRDRASSLGLRISSGTRKSELIDAIMAAQAPTDTPCHAAWFATGDALVIPRGSGIFAAVVDHLIEAARAGTLTVGGIGQSVFGTGLTLFDSRDLGPLARAEITETTHLYEQRMEDLEPVKKALKARGYGWYFLGSPTTMTTRPSGDAEVHYWLNGHSIRTAQGYRQPYGWYTAADLLAETFMKDLEDRRVAAPQQ